LPALTACTLPTTVTKFQKLATPADLRECEPEPAAVEAVKTDGELAGYILDLKDAGQDCRDKVHKRNQIEDAE
jgi:hypothetical protein